MPLSCYCGDEYDWYFFPDDDYSRLATRRGRKCESCGERISVDDLVLRCVCRGVPNDDVSERIHGHPEGSTSGVPLADRFMCERCADLYLSLAELGYCVNLGEDMRELVREYAEQQRERRTSAG